MLRTELTAELNAKTKMFVHQRDGRIAIGYNGLVKITANIDNAPPSLVWNRTLAISLNLDPVEFQQRFQQSRIRDDTIEWSSV